MSTTIKKRWICRLLFSSFSLTVGFGFIQMFPSHAWLICLSFFTAFLIGNLYHEKGYIRGHREGMDAAYAQIEEFAKKDQLRWLARREEIEETEKERSKLVARAINPQRNGYPVLAPGSQN